jgi:hypothetical protein
MAKFPFFFIKNCQIFEKKIYRGKILSPFDTLFIGNKGPKMEGGTSLE